MKLDLDRVRENARQATDESLLDRVTVYREEMEPAALEIFERELRQRGISIARIDSHAARREEDGVVRHPDGTVIRCYSCERPAVGQVWKWHRLWGWFLPLFPRYIWLCREHVEEFPTDAYGRALHRDEEN